MSQLKTPEHNHSMLKFGLFFFSCCPTELVFDSVESHNPVFFSAGFRFVFELKRMQKNSVRFLRSVVEREAKENFCFPEQ